jgi:hypothetical protein
MPERPNSNQPSYGFEQIGNSLRQIENKNLFIGIPGVKIFKNAPQPQLLNYLASLQFLKISLCDVKTAEIEDYLIQLESRPIKLDSYKTLNLNQLTLIDRYRLSLMIFGAIICFGGFVCLVTNLNTIFVLSSLSTTAGMLAFLFALLSTERWRRFCFSWILTKELLRRYGTDSQNGTGLNLPLSDFGTN